MIRIIKPGFYTSVQDLGRYGYRDIGVPLSGVMDSYSAIYANKILGNDPACAVLEITLGEMSLSFEKETVICLTGADFKININQQLAPLNRAIKIKAGDQLTYGYSAHGNYGYLGILGGLQTKIILGSRSFYKGITASHILQKDDLLDCKVDLHFKDHNNSLEMDNKVMESRDISAFKGPEFELLTDDQRNLLLNSEIELTPDCNRMGYRLLSPLKTGLPSILSSAVLPGTVQCTPSGKLIVLMRDGQVTGGYARVLQLSDMAINVLAQKKPKDKIVFQLVD